MERLLAIVIASGAVVAIWYYLRDVRVQGASHSAKALFDIIVEKYLDHQFSATSAPKEPEFSFLREAKHMALKKMMEAPQEWKESVQRLGTWQNKVAFELSVTLERLGLAVVYGVLPLDLLLPFVADQIIDDWRLCKSWVDSYRTDEGSYDKFEIPFQRRHAEWLALLVAVWMKKKYSGSKSIPEIEKMYRSDPVPVTIEYQLRYLSKGACDGLKPYLRREVLKLMGVNWFVRWPTSHSTWATRRALSNAE